MLAAFRYFYIICAILAIAAIVFISSFVRSHVESAILKKSAEQYAGNVVQDFIRDVWQPHSRIISQMPCEAATCDFVIPFTYDLARFFNEMPPILTYDLYFDDGRNMLKPGAFSADIAAASGAQFFDEARQGKVSSEIILGYRFKDKQYNVVRTYLPIIPDTSSPLRRERIPAVLILVHDITPVWSNPDLIQAVITIGMIVLFILLFVSIIYASWKTEKLLTQHYEKASELISAKENAEVESEEKTKFLANISHELRTPLNAIIGFSEILKDEVMGPINNPQYKDYINDIHSSGVHLLSLINDILDYSKADAGKLEVEFAEVDITKVMKNSLRLMDPRAKEAGVRLISGIPKEHIVIKTDAKRLKQVLLNLLSNAVKFTPSEGKVTLLAWRDINRKLAVIEVQDTGVGIAPKDIPKVMQMFGQVENELSRKYEGTGLGLPLSKRLLQMMGGSMDIQSKLNEGTIVTIRLPLAMDKEELDRVF